MSPVTHYVLELTEYRLRLSRPLIPAEATQLRGFFGRAYSNEVLLHHHQGEGQFLYDYPRVQFKVLDSVARLIGVEQGGAIVEQLWREVDAAHIGRDDLPVLEASLLKRRECFGESAETIAYHFRSPWLALNQDNHGRYEACTTDAERRTLLERVLVGNCLSLAKSFAHQVTVRLSADVSQLRSVPVRLKGVPMVGFRGAFRVNFHLPQWIGIGKSVSRGFGTVEGLTSFAREKPCSSRN
jgi:Cas6b C-terminal domain/Cas6b N-terminal domain